MYSADQVLSVLIIVMFLLIVYLYGPKNLVAGFFKWLPVVGFVLSTWWLIIWGLDNLQILLFEEEGFGIGHPEIAFVVMIGSIVWAVIDFRRSEVFTPHSPSGE